MPACVGKTCQLIRYQVTNVHVTEGLPANPEPGSSDGCRRLPDNGRNRRAIEDAIKAHVESLARVVDGEGCPDSCTCVQAGQASFGPPVPHTWEATLVFTRGDRTCKYKVKGKYDKAFAIVPGACTDGSDDLEEVEPVSFEYDEDDHAKVQCRESLLYQVPDDLSLRPLTMPNKTWWENLVLLGTYTSTIKEMKNEREPSGLGGWLILPMLGLIFLPLKLGGLLMTTYIPIFSEGYWGILTTPGSEAYHALWAPLLVFEITGNFIFLVSSIILLVLFFQKHYRFPRLMIVYLAANLVFVGTDFFLADLIPAVAAESDPESIRELIRTIIGAAIWIPYFCSSVRVKNTFTKGLIEQNVGHNAIYASGVERQSLARMSQLHVLENLKTLLTTLLLAMGIFSSLFGANSNEEYKTAKQYEKNRLSQIAMTPETMDQLRKYGVTDSSMPRLEYFFSTNTEEKAASLFEELQRLGYVGEFDKSANNSKGYVITGWTTKMAMDDKTVADWTALMCDLGKENDCDFDGWGTNPNQENEQVRTDRQRATPVNRPFEVQPNPGVPHLSVRTKA